MAMNKVPLNSNDNKIQQSHAKFYYLIKFCGLYGWYEKGGHKMKRVPKKRGAELGTTLRISLYYM